MSRLELLERCLGTLGVLDAYTEIPDIINTPELERRRTELAEFLRQERDIAKGTPEGIPSDDWYRDNAPGKDGELEIDDDAIVSRGIDSPGAYVQGWVWVYAPTCDDCDSVLPEAEADCAECARLLAEEEDDDA